MSLLRFTNFPKCAGLAFLLITFFLNFITRGEEIVILSDLAYDADCGNVNKLISDCGTMVTSDNEPSVIAKAYTLLAVAYTLQGDASKCADLLDLLPDDILASPAPSLVKYLAGKSSKEVIRKEISEHPYDWKAIAAFCELLKSIQAGEKGATLKKAFSHYRDSLHFVRQTNWSAAWASRTKLWYSWLRYGKGDSKSLEKLIRNRKGVTSSTEKVANNTSDPVQQVLKMYMDGQINPAKKTAVTLKKSIPKTSPSYMVLDFLSGNNSITPEKLFNATSKDAGLWALASLAMFAVELASAPQLYKDNLLFHLKNFDRNLKTAGNDKRLTQWRIEVPKWREWCETGFKSTPDLPILLRAKSVDATSKAMDEIAVSPIPDITTITLKEFIATRKPYAKRPKLVELQCSRKVLQAYFDSIPKKLRRGELNRYKTIKSIKDYIIRMLDRNPYPKGLILKKRRKINGMVVMANDKYLVYRKHNKSKRCYWKDLSYKQYAAFMKYYAKQRSNLNGVGKRSKKQIMADVAEDYVGIAMLYDWYKKYKSALFYARKAVKAYPQNKQSISNAMFP
jgi:hypothetical protein